MDSIKYQHWEGKIPKINALDKKNIKYIRKKICLKFLFSQKCDFIYLYKQYIKNHEIILNQEKSELFDVLNSLFFTYLKSSKEETIYLDWNGFEDIDKISIKDFLDNFKNIWYDSSDDLTIYNESAEWIISIYHYGIASFTLSPPILRCKKYPRLLRHQQIF